MVALAAAILAVTLAAAGPAEARAMRCGPEGARTVFVNHSVRLAYKSYRYAEADRLYGCWRGRRAQIVYDEACEDSGCVIADLFVSGPYVAYRKLECVRGAGCSTRIGIRDLRRRRGAETGIRRVHDLGIAANGTVVWTSSHNAFGEAEPPFSVHALTVDGQRSRLDEDDQLDPHSLAVGSRFAYWKRGSEIRSASVP